MPKIIYIDDAGNLIYSVSFNNKKSELRRSLTQFRRMVLPDSQNKKTVQTYPVNTFDTSGFSDQSIFS